MKNEVLDILILGLLVVLFASIYRKRATARLRCWVAGWILVLLHFAALLIPAVSGWGQELVDSVSLSALFLSGLCFLFSAPAIFETAREQGSGRGWRRFSGALLYQLRGLRWRLRVAAVYRRDVGRLRAGIVLAWKLCRGRSRVWAVITLAFSPGEIWTVAAVVASCPGSRHFGSSF